MQTTELLRVLHLVKEGKALLLDIRSPEEYCAAHLPGAILIPTPHPPLSPAQQDRLEQELLCVLRPNVKQEKNILIFVYCKKGIRAKQAQQLIRGFGFPNVFSLGGMSELPLMDWIGHGTQTCDFGTGSTHLNIEDMTNENKAFRQVLSTPGNMQLVVMSLLPGQDIGMERHPHVDQFIRIESGHGLATIRSPSSLKSNHFTVPLVPGDVLVIRHGDWHNVINTGQTRLNLYTLYAPPEHPPHLTQFQKPQSYENNKGL